MTWAKPCVPLRHAAGADTPETLGLLANPLSSALQQLRECGDVGFALRVGNARGVIVKAADVIAGIAPAVVDVDIDETTDAVFLRFQKGVTGPEIDRVAAQDVVAIVERSSQPRRSPRDYRA